MRTKSLRDLLLRAGRFAMVLPVMLVLAQTSTPSPGGQALVQSPSKTRGQSDTLLGDGRQLLVGGLNAGKVSGQVLVSGSSTNIQLIDPRYGHTATVLADGDIAIIGGIGGDGKPVTATEVITLQTGETQLIADSGLAPRSQHTATVLPDGEVLVAGGLGADGTPLGSAQLWDPQNGSVQTLTSGLVTARSGQNATLLSDGTVLLSGGRGAGGQAISTAELFDPRSRTFTGVNAVEESHLLAEASGGTAAVTQWLPASDAKEVPVDARVSILLNTPLQASADAASAVSVVGPAGSVAGNVVVAEQGRLLFFDPAAQWLPNTTYTAFLQGALARTGQRFSFTTSTFTTQRLSNTTSITGSVAQSPGKQAVPSSTVSSTNKSTSQAQSVKSKAVTRAATPKTEPSTPPPDETVAEDWIPQDQNRHGEWRVLGLSGDPRLSTANLSVTDLTAPSGETALAGHVLRYNGLPLAGVVVTVGTQSVQTDASGRFLITGLSSGVTQLKIDGTSVQINGRHYTQHFIRVNLKSGQTTLVPNPIYLPRVDPATEVSVSSPADHDLVLTHPAIPGLQVIIPKGAVLREPDGKIVSRLSITPVPVDRPPYPTPTRFSVYFTLQPGGAFIDGTASTASIRVIYPNYLGLPAGTRADFWNYDPDMGWQVYGHGTVSKDRKQIVPDANVGFRQNISFGMAVGPSNSPPTAAEPVNGCTTAADPVDCATGLFLHTETDLAIGDVMPVSVTRTYRQNDSTSRAFGIGTNISYAMWLYTSSSAAAPPEIDLIRSDGSKVAYLLQSGTGLADGVWTHTATPSIFYGSTLTSFNNSSGEGFTIVLRDRTVMTFARHAPNGLLSITDRNGNTVSITTTDPTTGGTITQVTSPNGRYIQFTYTNGVITQATDNIGRTVRYSYDSSGRLQTVTDPNGAVESYGYNSLNQMTKFTDKRGTLATQNTYNANGQVATQTLADGAVWQFSYTTTSTGTQTSVIDPRGYTRQDTFNTAGYLTQEILALGQPQQATYSYQLDSGNRIMLVTDPLGRQTHYTYDSFGDVLTRTSLYGTAKAVTETFTYDPTFNQVATEQDPLGNTATFGRDAFGNLASFTDPLGHKTLVTNNSQGLPIGIQDALGHQVSFGYLQADLASVTNAVGSAVTVFTDGVGRPQSVTGPLGSTTRYTYDPLDRTKQITDAGGGVTTLNYDPNGNLLSVTDPRNLGSQAYTYDSRNRVHTYTGPVGGTETSNYDGLGNLLSRLDRKSQNTQISYDPLNRPNLITYADGSTLTITWDAGNRAITFADSLNGTIQRTYDGLDRVLTESGPQGQVTYTYDADERRSTLSVSGQSTAITYQYDNANRLTQVAQGTTTIGYAYDAANRRTGITLPNGIVGTFNYDNANQLTSISYDGTAHVADATYGYDLAGRRTSASGTLVRPILDSILATTTYDAGNHLTALNGTAVTYDGNGNLVSMAGAAANTLTWNARDQLVQTAQGTSLGYDALGRLVSQTAGGASTSYLYDGSNQLAVNGNLFLRGLGLDELEAEVSASGTTSVLADGLGSVAMLSGANQAVSTSYSYGAYGAFASTGANGVANTSNPFGFAGANYNSVDQLVYLRGRYYSPAIERFSREDPIGLRGGINTYAYADGNPVSNIDPLGLWSVTGGGYAGPGAEVTLGFDDGHFFFTARVGFGIGIVAELDPNHEGGVPGGTEATGCKGGAVLSASVKGGVGFGPLFNIGAQGGAYNNVASGIQDLYHDGHANIINLDPKVLAAKEGFSANISIGAQVTLYKSSGL